MLDHGGKLRSAADRYGIPLSQWLDLSTGINPLGWPVPELSNETWRRLPEDEDDLEKVACAYYGCDVLLPVAGSQAALQRIPELRPPGRVGILTPGYSEHPAAWTGAGHEMICLAAGEIENAIDHLDVLLLSQPNNPDGQLFSPMVLQKWHRRLSSRGGWLVVDEAFMDVTPELSLANEAGRDGLILLRSLGKFFGLAGARVGFVLAEQLLLKRLKQKLGPWTISGPSRYIAIAALADSAWQQMMRIQLKTAGQRLSELLLNHGIEPVGGTALFQLAHTPESEHIYQRFARQGVLIRLFPELSAIRFGLPGIEQEWQRLETALAEL